MNNPLSYTDPSGYFSKSAGKILRSVVAIFLGFVATIATGPKGGFTVFSVIIGGAVGGFVATGTAEGAWQGAFTALLFAGVGSYFGKTAFNTGKYYAKVAAHGVVGGVSSVLHGGKFKHGFFSAAFTQALAHQIDTIDPDTDISLPRTMAAAVVGGTASKISGGKFANGAVTGAFSRLFNDEMHPGEDESNTKLATSYVESNGQGWIDEHGNVFPPDPFFNNPESALINVYPESVIPVFRGGKALVGVSKSAATTLGRALGPKSRLFGNSYYRGHGNAGIFNHGKRFRVGWSYNETTNHINFSVRIGKWHSDKYFNPIKMRPPPR